MAAVPPPVNPLADFAAEAKRSRTFLLVSGILAIITGFVAIVVPAIFSVATAILVGILLLILAGLLIGFAFGADSGGQTALRLVLAILAAIAGVYLLAAPLKGTFTLTVILAAWFFATGILRLVAAFGMRGEPGAGMVGLNGAVTLLLGILIAVSLPSSADWAIGLLVGIDFLFYGVTAIMLAGAVKKAAQG